MVPWPINKIVEWITDVIISFVEVVTGIAPSAIRQETLDAVDDTIILRGDIFLGENSTKTLVIKSDGTRDDSLSNVGATITSTDVFVDDISNDATGAITVVANHGLISGDAIIYVPKILGEVHLENNTDRNLVVGRVEPNEVE